ncbi:MAG: TIGR04211 family SH3 domain-containing protein [Gammaproteobacteria bacterium]|nr:TIGR04211 family SH3 domain-containing protein [Gammaproteobacteria bacterium]HOP16671.1 TIGR04211 family SH3 domain-containing protein [Gammaproteobacteria bacterium]
MRLEFHQVPSNGLRMPLAKRFLCIVLLLCSGLSVAAHITDKLVVGLYPSPKAEGVPLNLLSSGTPLEVLKRQDGFAEVRLADDSKGWIEATYITEEKPAKAMLLETQARLRQMGLELAALREKQTDSVSPEAPARELPPSAREAQLQRSLSEAEARIAELQAAADRPGGADAQRQLDELRARVQSALQTLAEVQGMTLHAASTGEDPGLLVRYREWIIGLAALLLGFAAGIAFIDYRIRKRYGGFRI